MPLSSGAEKLLNWMGPDGAKSLQEILNWGPLGDVDTDYVQDLCGRLVEDGHLTMQRTPDGQIVYRRKARAR